MTGLAVAVGVALTSWVWTMAAVAYVLWTYWWRPMWGEGGIQQELAELRRRVEALEGRIRTRGVSPTDEELAFEEQRARMRRAAWQDLTRG